MASPHQEARLAAASLLLSANPITGARVAQYESEDSLESLVAAGLAAAMEEEEQKKVWQMRASVVTTFLGRMKRWHSRAL